MKILLLNQCFYPDVVSTAQHAQDLACALTDAGHQVTVVAGNRGYDDSTLRFASSEAWKGIRIRRVPCLATGKGRRWARALNFASFFASCTIRLLFSSRFDVVIALTSPPLISVLAALFVNLRGGALIFWVMDLNPDEAIVAGWLRGDSIVARALEGLLRFSAKASRRVVVLDRFMKDRLLAKGVRAERITVLPPWSHDEHIRYDGSGREQFRIRHGLQNKFVVMYSGNHSPCHPLDTILGAALELRHEEGVRFCFVGGGSEQRKVSRFAAQNQLDNVLCLPYQPLNELSASLSAADLHVVVMGEPFAGLVHPCKIYNILATGIPALYVGPEQSHIADIAISAPDLPLEQFRHGDVAGVVGCIRRGIQADAPHEGMARTGDRFSSKKILPEWIGLIEATAAHPAGSPAPLQSAGGD